MQIDTKMVVESDASKVFEAIVDPEQIGGFWFSSSSERWETGKTVTVEYKEYDAVINLDITKVVPNELIEFKWDGRTIVISFEEESGQTLVTATEKGLDDNNVDFILGQKEGWVYMLSCLKSYVEFGNKIRAALR
ncbi:MULTISPECIES: SRPBCC domain-containing protein [Staphylococcus]|uniref:SRPBCC domain-containing protein n=1 Tax=Staphylococcus hsinchuensis TaxID=3051183 RepID=A0ABZ3EAR2_9STAP|nr:MULTISPECIES: SRPBCC domain-containing protein [unclassified Staphylococcus]